MNTEKYLYLALKNLLARLVDEGIGWPAHSTLVAATREANKAMDQFELELGPLPDWATAHNVAQEPVQYAQLYTLNGRQRGNGMIFKVIDRFPDEHLYCIITDMGNEIRASLQELQGIYEIGDYILNEAAYLKRKRQSDDYIEPLEHD